MEGLERAGHPVCGSVVVRGSEVNLALEVGACGGGSGGGRQPNAAELDILERWRRLRLDEMRFAPGELEAFVRQVLRL